MYALLSELLHDLLCNIPTYYNLSKIDLLSLRLSSMGRSLVKVLPGLLVSETIPVQLYCSSYIICSI